MIEQIPLGSVRATIEKLEEILAAVVEAENKLHELDNELGGSFAKVKQIQADLNKVWMSRRCFAKPESPESVAVRELIDRAQSLHAQLAPPPNGMHPAGTQQVMGIGGSPFNPRTGNL